MAVDSSVEVTVELCDGVLDVGILREPWSPSVALAVSAVGERFLGVEHPQTRNKEGATELRMPL